MPVNYKMPVEAEVPLLEFYKDSKSKRGGGGFGSTESK
jgi:dUTPase